jgi:hypothetical protein
MSLRTDNFERFIKTRSTSSPRVSKGLTNYCYTQSCSGCVNRAQVKKLCYLTGKDHKRMKEKYPEYFV